MDIYQALKKDHATVLGLFDQIRRKKPSPGKTHDDLFSGIKHELTIHTELEEKLFYPALIHDKSLHESILIAYEKHNIVSSLLDEMAEMSSGDDKWPAKLNVLHELLQKHIEEEEGPLFRKAHKVLEKSRSQEMGSQYEDEKEKMMISAH